MAGFLDRVRRSWVQKDEWPPRDVRKHWDEIESYRRRYRNDRDELIQHNPNIMTNEHKVSIYTPVPWPRELCRFSAALLFSETPRVSVGDSDEDNPEIDTLMRVNDFGAFAIEGGVQTACDGRVAIRIIRDPQIAPTPLLTLVPEDQIIWDQRHGRFYAGGMVVIERRVDDGPHDHHIYRLLEEHSKGLVTRTLYKGHARELGKKVALDSLQEFSGLAPEEYTGLDRPTLVPWENVPGSESDLFGIGPLFDDLNEQESLLLDRVRKAIPRAFVDKSLADETGRLDIDGYILTGGSRMRLPLGTTPGSTIETVQPPLQSAEAIAAIDHLQQLLVTCAGYSPLTWGIQGQTATVQRAVSGYAMKLSQLRTLLNRSAKEHMALQALGWGVATVLAWDHGGGQVAEMLPTIKLGDGLPSDPLDGAQEVLYLRQAMAAATETLVETVHPTWPRAKVESEAERIMAEGSVPAGAGPAQGVGPMPRHVRDLLPSDPDDPRAGGGTDPAPGA